MVKAIARARHWYGQLVLGEADSLQEIARLHKFSIEYVKHIFPLAFLGPASIEAILNQQCRPELSLDELCGNIQTDWTEQRRFAGV